MRYLLLFFALLLYITACTSSYYSLDWMRKETTLQSQCTLKNTAVTQLEEAKGRVVWKAVCAVDDDRFVEYRCSHSATHTLTQCLETDKSIRQNSQMWRKKIAEVTMWLRTITDCEYIVTRAYNHIGEYDVIIFDICGTFNRCMYQNGNIECSEIH